MRSLFASATTGKAAEPAPEAVAAEVTAPRAYAGRHRRLSPGRAPVTAETTQPPSVAAYGGY